MSIENEKTGEAAASPAQAVLFHLLRIAEQVVESGNDQACTDMTAGLMQGAAYIIASTTDASQDGRLIGAFGRLLADCRNAAAVSGIVADIQQKESEQ